MGAKKIGEQDTRNITQNGTGTYQVSLPIGLVRELGWRERQKVTVKKSGNKLIIEDWKK